MVSQFRTSKFLHRSNEPVNRSSPAPVRVMFLDHVGVLGGAELSLLDMVRRSSNTDHVILMADGPLRTKLEQAGIDVTVLPAADTFSKPRRMSGIFAALKTIPHVLKMARNVAGKLTNYDIVWANSQKSFVVGCFAALMAKKPLVWHMRDILSPADFSWINRHVSVWLANRFASKVITVSNAGRQSFIAAGGKPQLATVIHNGIDSAEFDAVDRPAAAKSLSDHFHTGAAPRVGLFGRLAPWKGQDILIKALPALPGVHAFIVGETLFGEDEYSASLHTLAEKLGVTDRVHFTGFRKEIPQLMSAMDVIVHTSTSPEPFGRVIVEAMLAGKPVIATDAGGAAEIIHHNHDGLLIPASQPALLADAIQKLLSDKSHADQLAKDGYQNAVQRFGLHAFLSNIDAVKNELTFRQAATVPSAVKQPTPLPPTFAAV